MIETIIKEIMKEYSKLKEKAIKLYVNYENEDELKKYGKFIHKGLYYGEEWKTLDGFVGFNSASGLANAAPVGESFRDAKTQMRVGFVSNDVIIRDSVSDVLAAPGTGGTAENRRTRSTDIGAVGIAPNAANDGAQFATLLR